MADFFKFSDGQLVNCDLISFVAVTSKLTTKPDTVCIRFTDNNHTVVVCDDHAAAQAELDRLYEHCK